MYSVSNQRANHLYRVRRILESAQGPEVTIEGKRYLAFCSNDYLGLANHPDVVKSFQQAAGRFGVSSAASHLVIGHHRVHRALEEELAAFLKRSRALVFSTGYMANLGCISALVSHRGSVFSDKLVHASLIDAIRLSGAKWHRYRHKDISHLLSCLKKSGMSDKLIVTDGLFSMDGDLAPLPDLVSAAQTSRSLLYVDDAHGIGVFGEGARGTLAEFGLGEGEVPILVGTFGKAFGTFGAFVSGSEDLIEHFIQFARTYIYTTALPPAVAEATRKSLRLIQQEPWRQNHLAALVRRFREAASTLGLPILPSNTPIQPVIIGASDRALTISHALLEKGIYVAAIRPPTVPPNQARLRITFSALHTLQHADALAEALHAVLRKQK